LDKVLPVKFDTFSHSWMGFCSKTGSFCRTTLAFRKP